MSARVITPHLRNLRPPAALGDLRGWLMWRLEEVPGNPKPRKVPYYVDGSRRYGAQGSPSDRARLTTFAAAASAAARRGMDGVGLALMPEWGITAVDFDHCVEGGQVIEPVLDAVAGTYAEFSPSGTGVRAFIIGQLGNAKSLGGEHPYGLELFSSTGYVTFTGNALPITRELDCADIVAEPNVQLQQLVQQRFARTRERTESTPADPMGVPLDTIEQLLAGLPSDLSYDEWVQVGMALHHELGDAGFELWDAWSSCSFKYSTREYGEDRWDSFGRYAGPPVTIRTLAHLAHQHGSTVSLTPPASPEDFDVIEDPVPEAQLRFPALTLAELAARPPLRWMIKGVLPRAQLGVLYGESGSGKSFAALDLALHLDQAMPWRGLRTERASVLYVAAEGASGMGGRFRAWHEHYGVDPAGIGVRTVVVRPNLLDPQHTRELIATIQSMGGAQLVVLDTLAQVTPGANENTSEDMGRALQHCAEITRTTGAMVLLVHHAGKDASRGARGWSGLRAACDVELEVIRDGDVRTLHVSKMKDGQDGLRYGFALNVVSLGEDEDGDPITSCVATPSEAVAVRADRGRSGEVQRTVMRVLRDMVALTDEPPHYDELVAAVVAQIPAGEGRDRRAEICKRAVDSLAKAGELSVANMLVSPE